MAFLLSPGCALAVRRSIATSSPSRLISTTKSLRNQTPVAPNLGTIQVHKRPVGGIRGGIAGFLLGFSGAAALASYTLLDEYKTASAALLASIEELQGSTDRLSAHVQRIKAVEQNLQALSDASASKEEISRVRAEVKRLYDGLHVEFLDLRSHVWGIQQDLHSLSKKDASSTARI